ncbi:MAG: Asp-tRNA(Asn)/Glu-tRNA(Gln) amidotransferase subunit GatC [Anaerolineaceae bacterium]|nr:MAG: Asp-tRNA(Asn)/Glu-tRNA(Gln) amidotransferase subunit GatC [Anaerolineaceae bacterium]
MKISKESFHNIADMVKLSFKEEEKLKLIKDLNHTVEFIETMNDMNTDSQEPMSYIHNLKNVFREDVASNAKAGQGLHENAPESMSDYYVVPPIFHD